MPALHNGTVPYTDDEILHAMGVWRQGCFGNDPSFAEPWSTLDKNPPQAVQTMRALGIEHKLPHMFDAHHWTEVALCVWAHNPTHPKKPVPQPAPAPAPAPVPAPARKVHTHILEEWPDVASYLEHIAQSGTRAYGDAQASLKDENNWAGMPLQAFRQGCEHHTLPDLRERLDAINTMAAGMLGSIPVGQTIRRKQIWTRQGHSVNIHKVLRGDLGHAWRKSVHRAVHTPGMGRVVLVIPSSVSANISAQQRQWILTASLVLAEHCYRQGRPLEIWSCGFHTHVFQDVPYAESNFVHLVCLRRSQDAWDSTSLVLTTYSEWLRRLQFRALEMHQESKGTIEYNYGGVMDSDGMRTYLKTSWAPAHGIPADCVMLGCTQFDNVNAQDSAQRWVETQLQTLENVA